MIPTISASSGFAVTGLANSDNFVPFYDKYGFQARVAVNHRAEYLQNFGQTQNNSQFGTEPTFVNAATYVDFSTSYDINKHFNVYFEALNLTNQVYATHGRFNEQLLDVVDTGRTLHARRSRETVAADVEHRWAAASRRPYFVAPHR